MKQSVDHHHALHNQRNLLITTLLNFVIAVAEIFGGLFSNSLSLISDALHNLGDSFATFIAYLAAKIGNRSPDYRRTFGFKRIEILAALLNAVLLIAITIYLFYESILRLGEPEPIRAFIMFIVATFGLLANAAGVLLLRKERKSNINVRAAYLHLLGDSLSSVAVIAGSILIIFLKVYWIDPVITILIGVYILRHAFLIVREAGEILMQTVPPGINLKMVQKAIEKIPGIANIHHVHVWSLDDNQIHFECHADLDTDIHISDSLAIREKIEKILYKQFNINHYTVQFEFDSCKDKGTVIGSR